MCAIINCSSLKEEREKKGGREGEREKEREKESKEETGGLMISFRELL